MFRQLDSNQLNGTIPSSIGNLAQLGGLYVHSCFQFRQQTHIKLTLSILTSIFYYVIMFRTLELNQLSGTIPSSIGNLAQLGYLYVDSWFHFQQQTHIKTHSFNPNFSILRMIMFRLLEDNQLSGTIPSSIGNLTQLQVLYVHSCFQFRQRTHIKLIQPKLLFLCVCLCLDFFMIINWVEPSLHRSVILPNFSPCMFILAFTFSSNPT